MRRDSRGLIASIVAAVVLVGLTAVPALAWHRHPGIFIGVGPYWWWGPPYPYWAYAPPPYYVYPPPPVVVEQGSVYVQQAPPASPPPPPPDGPYWYYCTSARAFYPAVSARPEAWVRVPPRPE